VRPQADPAGIARCIVGQSPRTHPADIEAYSAARLFMRVGERENCRTWAQEQRQTAAQEIRGLAVKRATTVVRKSLRLTAKHRERLTQILKESPRAGRFIRRVQEIIEHGQAPQGDGRLIPTLETLRANARGIQHAAKAMAAQISALTVPEKELLGQLMWVIDKKSYYPAAFTVDQALDTVRAVEAAANRLVTRVKGGRAGLRLDGFIRDVHSAYITTINRRPEISNARANDFMAALKVCLDAAGEPVPKAFVQLTRDALNP
jgi:hypothetical protein